MHYSKYTMEYLITENFGGGFNLAIWRLKTLLANFKCTNNIQLSCSAWCTCTRTCAHMTTRITATVFRSVLSVADLSFTHKLFADVWSTNVLENVMAIDTAANFVCFHCVLIQFAAHFSVMDRLSTNSTYEVLVYSICKSIAHEAHARGSIRQNLKLPNYMHS